MKFVEWFCVMGIVLGFFEPFEGYSVRCDLSNGARVVRGERSPIKILIKQGYYIRPGAKDEISKEGVRVVSFDWGGVLDMYKDKDFKEKIEQILDALKEADIKMVIISEGGSKEIWNELDKIEREEDGLKWSHYFDEVYPASRHLPSMTKRTILEKIAKNEGIAKNQIVHFEDTPSQVEKIGYRMGKDPEVFVVGVVGKAYTKAEDAKYRDLAEKLLKVAPAVISHLGIGIDKILKILNIKD